MLRKYTITGLITVAAVSGVGLLYTATVPASAADYIAQAREYTGGSTHNLDKAIELYEQALAVDATNQEALYNLARAYYVNREYDKSFDAIAAYKEQYPDNPRIHYVAGLAYGFAGDLDTAEAEFTAFLDSEINEWQGYLDLAWVYFQQGAFEDAQRVLKDGIAEHGANAWLNTSLGATLVARGEYERAEDVLRVAALQAKEVTLGDWQRNYSMNGPAAYEGGLTSLKSAIALNQSIASGDADVVLAAQALDSNFVASAPGGYLQGLTVSACGASLECEDVACTSEANACGQVSAGTREVCTVSGSDTTTDGENDDDDAGTDLEGSAGQCNATPPSLPNGYGNTCQVTDSCGNVASGTIGCDGSCSATAAGSCNPFVPSISSGSCTIGELFVVQVRATDPEGDDIRYGIDWDNDGAVDQFVPNSGFVSSGTAQSAGNVFSDTGPHTIRALTEDENGDQSAFNTHTFLCSEAPTGSDGSGSTGAGGFQGGTGAGAGSGNVTPNGSIAAQPLLVSRGDTTTVLWDTNNTVQCTVTGTNGDTFTGTSGTRTTSAIDSRTTYELNCDGGTVVDSVTVNVLPRFREF